MEKINASVSGSAKQTDFGIWDFFIYICNSVSVENAQKIQLSCGKFKLSVLNFSHNNHGRRKYVVVLILLRNGSNCSILKLKSSGFDTFIDWNRYGSILLKTLHLRICNRVNLLIMYAYNLSKKSQLKHMY